MVKRFIFSDWCIILLRDDVIASAYMGGYQLDHRVPDVVGGVLKNECDHAFWCAFSMFRNEDYYKSMSEKGLDDYIRVSNKRFPCVTMPLFHTQYN